VLAFVPDANPSFGAEPLPFVLLMLAGFLVGIFGHIYKKQAVVVIGIGMIFLATFLLPLAVYLSRG
jgi:hypothetical protein